MARGNHLLKNTFLPTSFTHPGHHLPATASTRCFAVRDLRHAAASSICGRFSSTEQLLKNDWGDIEDFASYLFFPRNSFAVVTA